MITLHRTFLAWLAILPWRRLPAGIPGLVGGLLAVALLGFVAVVGPGGPETRVRYRHTAASALARRDFDTARVAALRGLSLAGSSYDRSESLLQLSLALRGLGREREAVALLHAAAPEEQPGSFSGHLLIARSLLISTNLTPQTLESVEHHLRNALALEPESPDVREMLGRFYINVGRPEQARQYLRDAYPTRNEVALLVAIASRLKGDSEGTASWADLAAEAFQRRLKEPPSESADRFPFRLGWSQALAVRRNFDAAFAVLAAGTPTNQPCPPQYATAIADLCRAWAESGPDRTDGDRVTRYDRIRRGLGYAPLHAGLWSLLADFARLPADGPASVIASLERIVPRVEDPSLLHFLLWNLERARGNTDAARRHLETAWRLAPRIPAIANDRAMDLATRDAGSLATSLALVEDVLRDYPDQPAFRDTRGQILLRLGRPREALGDLEFALARLPDNPETREAQVAARAALASASPEGASAPENGRRP